jgi:transcriptional regulator GlxA family with amidase domain
MYVKIIDLYIAMARCYNNKILSPHPPAGLSKIAGNRASVYSGGPPDARPNKWQQYIARLNAVFEYIDNHLSEKLTLKNVAEIAHFSTSHFDRIFKKYTNSSFYHYLKRIRVKRAENLLLNPELSITAVALDAGFESIATFNRAFKEIKRCTPSEYKKLYYWNP